jgi:hypothetical protein
MFESRADNLYPVGTRSQIRAANKRAWGSEGFRRTARGTFDRKYSSVSKSGVFQMNSTTRSEPGAGALAADWSQRDSEPSLRAKTADTMSELGDAAKKAADTLVSATTEKLKDVANQQVAAGADFAGHVGASVRAAGKHLESNAPQIACLVFSAAQTIEQSADQLRGQSIDELARSTAEFARQRPEIVFSLAAVSGFLLFRLLNAGISIATGPSYAAGRRPMVGSDPSRSINPSFHPA